MRMRRAHDDGMRHARQIDVIDELAGAFEQTLVLKARHRLS
jgi:hypothetical protein